MISNKPSPYPIRSSSRSGGTVKHTGYIIIGQVMHEPSALPEIETDPADEPFEPIGAVRLITGGGDPAGGQLLRSKIKVFLFGKFPDLLFVPVKTFTDWQMKLTI